MTFRSIRAGLLAVALAASSFVVVPFAAADDSGAIRHLMTATFQTPDAPLLVEPIVVAEDWAVVGWSQDGRGGRALLKRKAEGWAIHLCAGDALTSAEALRHMGLAPDLADRLAAEVASAEAAIDPARVALFSTFEGIVEMAADGSHPPHGGHGSHGDHAGHTAHHGK